MAGGGDRAGDGDLSRRPIAASFLHYLLPSPKPRSSSPPPANPLVPPHRLMAPPLPRDESLFIVRPERPSWLPPPPPPHPAAPPHERKPRAFAVGGRKAPPFPVGRPHTGPFRTEGGGVGRESRKVGAFVGNGGGTSTERQKAAQKEKKVWVAVDRRQEKGCDEEVVVVGDGNVGGEDGVLEEEVEEEEGDGVLEDEVKNSLVIGDGEVGGGGGERLRLSKDLMSDSPTGLQVPGFRGRMHRRKIICRPDIETLTSGLLSLYESLKPQEEQKCKQKQLIVSLKESVNKEWPDAQLHLFGSSANSFGTFHSDVDVCLAIDKSAGSSTNILLKLADILEADNFENVEAITNARVPIVRMSDPESGISCDICINNVFAVANTKLLKDYAQIDDRLLQLAFIVKYWAKSRGVNETYHGTLSSYAYVLMCINFLQLREPSILPCLQTMEPTYTMIADDTECAYFDKVHQLADFGAENKEGIAELLWAFFHYWAYGHNYRNDVISVRTGKIISKREKNWTTRVANDRHLMCIEDPFETVHDLGRVVDRRTLRILTEEFERAAEILQYDDNPCLTLFEPYELGSAQHDWP